MSPLPHRASFRAHRELIGRSGGGGADTAAAVEAGGVLRVVRFTREAEGVEDVEYLRLIANRPSGFDPPGQCASVVDGFLRKGRRHNRILLEKSEWKFIFP